MRLILDTHILLWSLIDDDRLSDACRSMLVDPLNNKFVSVVSLWEIAIKFQRPRGRRNNMPVDAVTARELIDAAGYHFLPVAPEHAAAVGVLPMENHRDPFDRMLVAQAISGGMMLLTRDAALAGYGERVLVV